MKEKKKQITWEELDKFIEDHPNMKSEELFLCKDVKDVKKSLKDK